VACIWQEAEQVVAGVGAPRLRGLVQGRVPRALWAREVQAFGPCPRARCHRAACIAPRGRNALHWPECSALGMSQRPLAGDTLAGRTVCTGPIAADG
jgi:hypothetical protein